MKKQITYEQYQEAQTIVNKYIAQLVIENQKAKESLEKKTIGEWIAEKRRLPNLNNNHTRLFSVLKNIANSGYNEYKYIEEIAVLDLKRFRDVGNKTQEAFNELYYS